MRNAAVTGASQATIPEPSYHAKSEKLPTSATFALVLFVQDSA